MKAAILLGATEGLLIALLGVGVVLVYKAERFVNLAHAQLGVLSSLVLAKLVLDAGVSWYLAFVLAMAVGVIIGAASRWFLLSPLAERSRSALMIATLGLSQLLLALAYFEWLGPDRRRLRIEGYPLPFGFQQMFDGLAVTTRHLLIAGMAPLVLLALVLWLHRSAFGRAMRAAASNPDAARLAGIDIRRTSTVAWGIAGGLSALAAVLDAPGHLSLEAQATGPVLLFLGLGAAGLAGFTSLPGAAAAGVGLGIVEGVGIHIGHSTGAGMVAVFVVVLGGLVMRSLAVGGAEADDVQVERSDEPLRIPAAFAGHWFLRRRVLVRGVATTAVALVLPVLPWVGAPHRTYLLANAMVMALAALSLTIVTGWGGQVSLGQFTILGTGAFTAANLAPRGWSLVATMVVTGAVGVALMVVIGLSAARSRGLTFAVTSLGVAVIGPAWLFRQPWVAPEIPTAAPAYQAGLGRLVTQRSLYFVALAALVLVAVALTRFRGRNPGRAIMAVRDNPRAGATFGLSTATVRLTTFAMSGALVGVAGALWLAVNRNLGAAVIDPAVSQLLLSAVVIGGVTSVSGAIVAAVLMFGVSGLLADPLTFIIPSTIQLQLLLGGAGLLLGQVQFPGGIAYAQRRAFQRLLDRRAAVVEHVGAPPAPPDLAAPAAPAASVRIAATSPNGNPRPQGTALAVCDLRVAFDGVVAVDGVGIEVAAGEIVGVIGANGAGKTTLLDAVCGLTRAEGTVSLYGCDVSALAPDQRAQLGMSRGFQDARLFPALSVRETIELALDRRHPVGRVGTLVAAPWTRLAERAIAAEAGSIIDRYGLTPYADLPGDRLSTGTRHICDFAAQAATRPRLMVLDEPTSGIAQREAEAFGPLLRGIADDLGCGMLIVEHDMPFLMAVADRIYCLERGRVIAEGPPAVVRKDPAVVASYLGAPQARRGRRRKATA